MLVGMHSTAATANSGTATRCGKKRQTGDWLRAVMRVVHGAWTTKKAINLAACAGIKIRAAEYVVGGHTAPSSDALVNLLRSDELGPQLLDALLGDIDWYQQRINLQRIGEAEIERAAAIRAHESLKAQIGRHRR